MTNLIGFEGKWNDFRNETFEKRCGATPRIDHALLAMTRLIGFAGKQNNFRNETFERRCGATTQKNPKKITAKNEKRPFSNKNVPIFVSLRGRSAAVAILKFEVWHPVAKHGSTKQEEIPITKTWIRSVVPRSLSSLQGSVSFRATIVRFGMASRSVKDCRVGRKNAPSSQ